MKIKSFHFVVFSLLIIFAVVSFGGCGTNAAQYYVLDSENPDTDWDWVIDILDFNDIEEKYYGPNGRSIGTMSYNVSTAVTSDLNAGKEDTKHILQYSGREWNIDDLDAGEGYIFCHIRIIANNTHDDERTAYYPTIATRKPTYFFKSGATRWNEWKFILQSMRFTRDLYPFLGLD